MSDQQRDAMTYSIQELMEQAIALKASDLHLSPGRPPLMRVNGELVALDGVAPLTPEDTVALAEQTVSEEHWDHFEKTREFDMSVSEPGIGRFRVNLHWQRGTVAIALRSIPYEIPKFDKLGLPDLIEDIAKKDRGLFIVSGPTGSGKTTTLASVLDYINTHRSCHIVTIEDPIEYLHRHKKSLVTQREMHSDTLSFSKALRHVLRQDPDVILIGEMRDLETIQTALTLAETGHLVLATLHTGDVTQALSRIVDAYPPYQQGQARTLLSFVLLGVLVQQLIRRVDGTDRVLAYEALLVTPAVRHLIRSNETQQIYSTMQTGRAEGMSTLNASLLKLFRKGVISRRSALQKTTRAKELLEHLDA